MISLKKIIESNQKGEDTKRKSFYSKGNRSISLFMAATICVII